MKIDELVSKNKINEQAAPNMAEVARYLGTQNPSLKPPSVQNALTQFLTNNPDLARQAAANMNAAPSSNTRINPGSFFKGALGRALGVIGLILTPSDLGDGTLPEATRIAMELQRDLLKNNPEAYIDMVNAGVAAMSDTEKQQMEDGDLPDPRKSQNYAAAAEAVRIKRQTDFAPTEEPNIPETKPEWWPDDVPFNEPTPGEEDEPITIPPVEEPVEPPAEPEQPAEPDPEDLPTIIPPAPGPAPEVDPTPPAEPTAPEPEKDDPAKLPGEETPVEIPDTPVLPDVTEPAPDETPAPAEEPAPDETPAPAEEPGRNRPPMPGDLPEPLPTPVGPLPITPVLPIPRTAPNPITVPGTTPDTGTTPRPGTGTTNTPSGKGPEDKKRRPGGKLPGLTLSMKSPLLPIADPLELSRTIGNK